MENKRKHLEFIQSAINRMSGNLFFLKGWSITLISALFALLVGGAKQNFLFVIYFLIIMFWILDGYYLSQERLFRELYDSVRKLQEKEIDFSMNTKKYKKYWKNSLCASIFSSTLMIFYLPLTVCVLLAMFLVG